MRKTLADARYLSSPLPCVACRTKRLQEIDPFRAEFVGCPIFTDQEVTVNKLWEWRDFDPDVIRMILGCPGCLAKRKQSIERAATAEIFWYKQPPEERPRDLTGMLVMSTGDGWCEIL